MKNLGLLWLVAVLALLFGRVESRPELAEELYPLEEPTLANAKKVVSALDARDSESSVDLTDLEKRVMTSIRNLFTAEYKLEAARKESEALEDQAVAWEKKAEMWLIPNGFGEINESLSMSAGEKAQECRVKADRLVAEAQKDMLPALRHMDETILTLRSAAEFKSMVILANALSDVHRRSGVSSLFSPSLSSHSLADIRELIDKRDTWLSDAREAEKAGDYLAALMIYRKAQDSDSYRRAARSYAQELEERGLDGSALDYFMLSGSHNDAARIRRSNPDLKQESFVSMDAETLFATVAPKVVRIRTTNSGDKSLGSGFFVWRGGYVLTNNHVIDGATSITVITNDSIEHEAEIIAASETPDFALLKIDLDDHGVLLLSSDAEVKTGLGVALIGYPQVDLETATLNTGRISNTNRVFADNPVFQLDVSANHGNSGGPVVDSRGRLVGVMTFGLGDFDIDRFNFCIRADSAREFLEKSLPTGYR